MSQPVSREPTHWMNASRLGGLPSLGRRTCPGGPRGGEQPLELHVAEHVRGEAETELAATRGVEGLEPRREDDGADFQLGRFFGLIVVDGLGLADLRAQPALPGAEVDATLAVDDRHARRCLGMRQVDRGPAAEILVVPCQVRFEPPGGDCGQVDGPRRADHCAGPARLALVGWFLKGGADFPCAAAAEEVDGPSAHHFVADACVQRPQRTHFSPASGSKGVA